VLQGGHSACIVVDCVEKPTDNTGGKPDYFSEVPIRLAGSRK